MTVRSRASAGRKLFSGCVRWLAIPVTAATAVGVLAVPAGARVADHDPLGRAGAAAGSPSGARRAAPSAGRRVGVPQPLTRDSRTVRHANGRYTTTIYPGSVNYRTPSGWRPIDSSLVAAGEAGFAWRNKANRFTASFARRAGAGYLRVRTAGGQTFDFDAKGAAGQAGAVSGSHLGYGSAYPGADLTYDVGADAVNEAIVLRDASAPSSYEFVIRARGGGFRCGWTRRSRSSRTPRTRASPRRAATARLMWGTGWRSARNRRMPGGLLCSS